MTISVKMHEKVFLKRGLTSGEKVCIIKKQSTPVLGRRFCFIPVLRQQVLQRDMSRIGKDFNVTDDAVFVVKRGDLYL